MLEALDREARLRLLKLVCSFAWVDREVQVAEQAFARELARRLQLDEAEREQVEAWLRTPIAPDEIATSAIPMAHRDLFIAAARETMMVDGRYDESEGKALEDLERRLR